MKRLAIITTHPIQYYAPVFKLLHQRGKIEIKVFYTLGQREHKFDHGFGKTVDWDIPLLEGYPYESVLNTATKPGSHNFKGVINPQITEQVQAWNPDALLVYGWAYQGHLRILRFFNKKVPIYFRGDSTLLDEQQGIRSLLRSVLLKWVYHYVDHAFFVGKNNKDYFIKYGLKENQLSFAPHAVDNDRFAASKWEDALLLRKGLKIKSDDIVVLFAGKLEHKKAPLELLDAFISLNRSNVHLLYVGNGSLEKTLKVRAHGILNVHFIDFQNQSQMPVIYQACDLFCLPSKGPGESWGLSVNEAMACGKPILVSDKVGCAADLVIEGVNGAVFKASDINSIIEKLRMVTADKTMLSAYGERSRSIIKDWNFENMAVAIEKKMNETD